MPFAEVDDVRTLPGEQRQQTYAKGDLFDANRFSAPTGGESLGEHRIPSDRRDRALGGTRWATALDQGDVELWFLAQRLKAFAGERLESASGMVKTRACQQNACRRRFAG